MKNCACSIAFLLCAISASSISAQTDGNFSKANQDYAQGHFKESISGYEALVRAGQWSANLFYDLGNAYFRTGDFGHAILNYERALALERHQNPERAGRLGLCGAAQHSARLDFGEGRRASAPVAACFGKNKASPGLRRRYTLLDHLRRARSDAPRLLALVRRSVLCTRLS